MPPLIVGSGLLEAQEEVSLKAEPVHVQVAARLAREIARGTWRPNEPLPPQLTLAQRLGVGRQTVRRALLILVEEGHVVLRGGPHSAVVADGVSPAPTGRSAVQIADALAAEIERGERKRGTQLPNGAALQRRFGVSRSTVGRVVRLLFERGLVVPRGKGRTPRIAGGAHPPDLSGAELAETLAGLIDDGTWPCGAELPSHRELAQRVGARPVAVRKAMALLVARRLVARGGRGSRLRVVGRSALHEPCGSTPLVWTTGATRPRRCATPGAP